MLACNGVELILTASARITPCATASARCIDPSSSSPVREGVDLSDNTQAQCEIAPSDAAVVKGEHHQRPHTAQRAPAGPEPGICASLGHTSAAWERQKRPWL